MTGPRRRGLPSGPASIKRPTMGGPAPARRPSDWDGQEERAAAAVPDGKRTRGSGSGWKPGEKGDVKGGAWRVETKTTAEKGLRIERAWLVKISHEAMTTGQLPAFVFGFDADTRGLCTEDPAQYLNGTRLDWMAFQMSEAEAMMNAVAALQAGDVDAARAWAARLRP